MTQRGPGSSSVPQELAGAVVHGFYRLVKACMFHADAGNDVITQLSAAATLAVQDYCARGEVETVALSFLGDAVFVNRQILKVSRDMHALALELGTFLEVAAVTELTFSANVGRGTVGAFAKLVADAQRDRSLAARITAGGIPGITAGQAKFASGGTQAEESPGQKAARTYATSVLTVQAVLADVRARKFELPKRIKRVAQQVVARADEDARLLVALAANGGGTLDAATIAVGSAILAVAMTRQLTSDRGILVNAAMTALLYDAGRVGLGGNGDGPLRTLNDDELDAVPAHTVVSLTAIGRMHAPARARTTLLYEVWSMRRAHRLGPLYKGRRPPSLLARIINVARAFSELRGAGAEGGLSIDDALQVLQNRAVDGTDRAIVKIFIGALGIYPAGTMVTLNTGELGVVLTTPANPLDYVRPSVKILYDADASLLETPIDVDLAAQPPGRALRFVASAVDADEHQQKAMRKYVTEAMAAKRRAAEPEHRAAFVERVTTGASAPPLRPLSIPVPGPTIRPAVAVPRHPSGEMPITIRPAAEPILESGGLDLSDLMGRPASSPMERIVSDPPLSTTKPPLIQADLISTSPPILEPLISSSPPVLEPIESSLPPILEPLISTKPPEVAKAEDAAPAPARRRDPRNDTAPPAGLVEEILKPIPVIKRLVPLNVPIPDAAPTAVPPTPASKPVTPPPTQVVETTKPKEAVGKPKEASPQYENWDDFDLGPSDAPLAPTQTAAMTDPAPPPAVEMEAPPLPKPPRAASVPKPLPPPPRAAGASPPKPLPPPPAKAAPPPLPPVAEKALDTALEKAPAKVPDGPLVPEPARTSWGPDGGVDAFLNDALRELSQPPPALKDDKNPKKG